jgi:hypothetical protein
MMLKSLREVVFLLNMVVGILNLLCGAYHEQMMLYLQVRQFAWCVDVYWWAVRRSYAALVILCVSLSMVVCVMK